MNKITPRQNLSVFATLLAIVGIVASGPVLANVSDGHGDNATTEAHDEMTAGNMMPGMNADRGRKLFVDKGCVACHSINGVGGHDATPLDAHTMQPMMNPFDFAAKMWAMAPYMIEAQEEALGGQILFTGEELADIIAFVHDDGAQHHFTTGDLTPAALKMMDHGHGGGDDDPVEAHSEEIGHMGGASHGHDENQEGAGYKN